MAPLYPFPYHSTQASINFVALCQGTMTRLHYDRTTFPVIIEWDATYKVLIVTTRETISGLLLEIKTLFNRSELTDLGVRDHDGEMVRLRPENYNDVDMGDLLDYLKGRGSCQRFML